MESQDLRASFQSQGRLVEVSKVTDQGQVKLTKRVVLSKLTRIYNSIWLDFQKSPLSDFIKRDEGLFILDWRHFYQPKNGSVGLDQSQ